MERNLQSFVEYRFGFNGKENTDEIYGEFAGIDFGARIYDGRLGKWFSMDPLWKDYASLSSYCFSANSPIWLLDGDGKKIIAFDVASEELILRTINYAFGENFAQNNGFSFVNRELVHNNTIPVGLSEEQSLMLSYLLDVLVNSQTEVLIKANSSSATYTDNTGELKLLFIGESAAASTFEIPAYTVTEKNENNVPFVTASGEYRNIILVPISTMLGGNNVATSNGWTSVPTEYNLFHEFGHAIMNVIKEEFGNQYNGQDYSKLTEEERSDFSIRWSNTLNKDKKQPQENGDGQHGRAVGQLPKSKPEPLTK